MDIEPVGTSLIGYGYWGKIISQNLHEMECIDFLKICDKDSSKLSEANEKFGDSVISGDDLSKTIRPDPVEMIVVSTPPKTHFEIGKKVLENGKHLLIEKPMAMTSEQCEEMVKIADKNNVRIAVEHTFLYSDKIRLLKTLIDTGEIGRPHRVHSRRLSGDPTREVDMIMDLAPHDVSIMNYLFGKYINVDHVDYGHQTNIKMNFKRGDERSNNSVRCSIDLAWEWPEKKREMTIFSRDGIIQYDDVSNQSIWVNYNDGGSYTIEVNEQEPLEKELQEFCKVIRDRDGWIFSGKDEKKVVSILNQIQEKK